MQHCYCNYVLTSRIDVLEERLRKFEWSVPDVDYPNVNRCPECGQMEPHGHGDTTGPCALDGLLNSTETKP